MSILMINILSDPTKNIIYKSITGAMSTYNTSGVSKIAVTKTATVITTTTSSSSSKSTSGTVVSTAALSIL